MKLLITLCFVPFFAVTAILCLAGLLVGAVFAIVDMGIDKVLGVKE